MSNASVQRRPTLIAKCEESAFGAFFYFDNLVLTVRGGTQFPQYEQTKLTLPQSIGHKDDRLSRLAKFDADHFSAVVHVRHITWNPAYLSENLPYIEFTFTIFNGSVFDLTVVDTIEGFISFGHERLGGYLWFSDKPIKIIKHGDHYRLKICQRLDDKEVKFISEAPEADMRFAFEFDKLIIKLSSEGLDPTPLFLPFSIDKNSTAHY